MDHTLELTQQRREKLARSIFDGIAIVLSSPAISHPAEKYRYNPNLYYLTGTTEPDCAFVLIAKKGRISEEILYCRPRDAVYERWHGSLLGPLRSKRTLGIAETNPWQSHNLVLRHHANSHQRLFMEFNTTHARQASDSNFHFSSVNDLRPLCAQLRAIKDSHELERIRASAMLTCKAFNNLLQELPSARSEADLAATLSFTYIAGGGDHAFVPIVASGANACIAHYHQNNARLRRGRMLLVDSGCELAAYTADMSRSIPVSGKFSSAQKDMYNVVLAAQRKAIAKIKPNGSLADAQKAARRELARGLVYLGICRGKINLILKSPELAKYYFHSIGHMVGLEVHDPQYGEKGNEKLKKNMVVTIEPGLYLDNSVAVPKEIRNTGIRIEDTVAIGTNGPEIFTSQAPKTIRELRAAMS